MSKENQALETIRDQAQRWQRKLAAAADVALRKNMARLVPAEPFGPEMTRFRNPETALVSWPTKQAQSWNFSGYLRSVAGREMAFQLYFLEHRTQQDTMARVPLHWIRPRVVSAVFSLIDFQNGDPARTFRTFHKRGWVSRYPGFSSEERLHLETGGWYASRETGGNGFRVYASGGDVSLQLDFTSGEIQYSGQEGYLQRSDRAEESVFACALHGLKGRGKLLLDDKLHIIEAEGRLEHEKSTVPAGTNALTSWDALSVTLATGENLNIFLPQPNRDAYMVADWHEPGKTQRHFVASEISTEVTEYWESPVTGTRYPLRRVIKIEPLELELEIKSLVHAQEVLGPMRKSPASWRGAVQATGKHRGQPASGVGHMGLFGYKEARK